MYRIAFIEHASKLFRGNEPKQEGCSLPVAVGANERPGFRLLEARGEHRNNYAIQEQFSDKYTGTV